MIKEGIVRKKGMLGFEIDSTPMSTGNMVMWFNLKELAKRKQWIRIEGVMETSMFRQQFTPVRFLA